MDTDNYFCVPQPKVYVELFRVQLKVLLLEPLRVNFRLHVTASDESVVPVLEEVALLVFSEHSEKK